ncbi:MAG: ATP-binding protein [Desulfobacteraceae bacterium]|nr:MAG: ATP-binding protein [Desulfobacteraceae bacterium]
MNPYQVLGAYPVVMRGRKRLFQKLCNHLTKPTPDHVSVIGPKHIGKTVLLLHLSDFFARKGEHYLTSVYWDLRHRTPESDADFKRDLAGRIGQGLEQVRPDLARELLDGENGKGDVITTVLEILEEEKVRILLVLDGFDRVLAGAKLTRNLWDYMRDLAGRRSIRLVTGSRQRLQELCKTEDSRTSDFWEIFYDTPVQVGPFEEEDWDGLLSPFASRGISFKAGAPKELVNWTGGVPVLSAALLSRLYDRVGDGEEVTPADINALGGMVLAECRDMLGGLWEDCTPDMQADLAVLTDKEAELSVQEIPHLRLKSLEDRGYISVARNRVTSSCRIFQQYAGQQRTEVENLHRLFGSEEKFDANIRSFLQMRLSQVHGADQKLYGYVDRAIRDLLPEPELAINGMRGIADYALRLVWNAELSKDLSIPSAWIEQWKFDGEKVMDEILSAKLPASLTGQCRLLQLMTGTQKSQPLARFVTKPTYLLIDHLQSVGHFGQHIGRNPVTLPFAACACFAAIALCEGLARELTKANGGASGIHPIQGPQ